MKEQYVGDISDYRKYALLRALSAGGANRIGIAWMLTPSDTSTDGGKLAYLEQPGKHRSFDPELFDLLEHAIAEPSRRRLQSIEESGAVPGASYFNTVLGDKAEERRGYMEACRIALADADLVFFDPDNGLDTASTKPGRKGSSRYLFLDEVAGFYERGQSLLIYQHFGRVSRASFIASCLDRLRTIAPDAVLGTFQTAHVVFLLVLHPNAPETLRQAARAAASRWKPGIMAGQLHEPGSPDAAQLSA